MRAVTSDDLRGPWAAMQCKACDELHVLIGSGHTPLQAAERPSEPMHTPKAEHDNLQVECENAGAVPDLHSANVFCIHPVARKVHPIV